MGELHFGYKRHTVTDENGLILVEVTTLANESDIKHLENPLKKTKLLGGGFADKGDSAENRKILIQIKLKSRLMHKGTRIHKITEREQRGNVAVSRTRYKVERTFGSIRRDGFDRELPDMWGLAKIHTQHMMEAIAYKLYRTHRIIVSNSLK